MGRKVTEAAVRSNLKKVGTVLVSLLEFTSYLLFAKVSLELGGKSPNTIFESADLERDKADLESLSRNLVLNDSSCSLGRTRYIL